MKEFKSLKLNKNLLFQRFFEFLNYDTYIYEINNDFISILNPILFFM